MTRQHDGMTTYDETLSFSLKSLMAQLCDQNISMPVSEQPWHELLYYLKSVESKPRFLAELIFDWDGAYPRSQELSKFLCTLRWIVGITTFSPYHEFELPIEVTELWKRRISQASPEIKKFLEIAVERARTTFP